MMIFIYKIKAYASFHDFSIQISRTTLDITILNIFPTCIFLIFLAYPCSLELMNWVKWKSGFLKYFEIE